MTTTGTWSITGNDTVTASIAGKQASIVVNPGNANRYVLSGYPNPATACQQNNITVTVYDVYNNLDTTYTGTVALSSSDASAALAANYTFVAGDAGTKDLPVTLHTVGSWNIKGNDTLSPSVAGIQSAIVVKHNSATYYTVTGFPNPSTAGQQGNVTITAYDGCGNLDTNYVGTVHLTSTDPNAVLAANYTFTAANAGVATRQVTLKASKGQNINANDTVTTSISGQQNVLVNPNVTTYYTVIYPAQINIAAQANVFVTAQDYYNNVGTNYTGTVKIRSTDPNATLPANYTYTAANAGVARLPVSLNSWGTWVVSANDTVTPTIAGRQGNILVAFTPMSTAPSGAAGLSGQVWHRGNSNTGTDPPALADLVAQYNYAQATSPNYSFVNSNFNGTRHLVYSGSTSSQTNAYLGADASGLASSDTSTMLTTLFMYSGYMVVAAGGNYTIATTNADDGVIAYIGGGPQGGNTTLVTLRNWNSSITTAPGYAQPAILPFNQAGAYPIDIFHFNQGGGGGLDFNVYGPATVSFLTGPAPWVGITTRFTVATTPNPIVAGTQGNVIVTAYDANGLVSTYAGAIALSSGDTTAILSTPFAVTSSPATVPVLFRSAGTWSLSANDVSFAGVAGSQSNIVVTDSGVATYLTLTYNNTTAGTQGNVIITATNASGTVATNYRGTVKVTSSDPNTTLPANFTFLAANNGVASLPVTLKMISVSTTLAAADISNSTINGSIGNIQVYPAPNATAPGGSSGLKCSVWHRLQDHSVGSPPSLGDMATALAWARSNTATYSFTNTRINSTLAFAYNGNDYTPTNTFLGSDAAGSASSDSNQLQTTYFDYTGYLHATTGGNFTFTLSSSDDGIVLYMGGGTAPGVTTMLMAGNWGAGTLLSNFASPLVLHLPAAGYYPFEVFYENEYSTGGGASLGFQISGPGTTTFVTGPAIGFRSREPQVACTPSSEAYTLAPVPSAPDIAWAEPKSVAWMPQTVDANAPAYPYSVFPYLPNKDGRHHLAFWSDGTVYRHEVNAPEALGSSQGGRAVLTSQSFHAQGTLAKPKMAGIWLLNAVRKTDGTLVGLYRRAEHQPKPYDGDAVRYTTGTALSADEGRTWEQQGPVVGDFSTADAKGVASEVTCMIFDGSRQRWLGIGHGLGYTSRDPNAAPGTWYGWSEGRFDQPEPDITGSNLTEPLPGLTEDMDECKLHYNTYLELFVLLWRPWDGEAIKQSYSHDGVVWSKPTTLMRSTSQQKLSHAQIIGVSDVLHGQRAQLIYQLRTPGQADRATLMQRPMTFMAPKAD